METRRLHATDAPATAGRERRLLPLSAPESGLPRRRISTSTVADSLLLRTQLGLRPSSHHALLIARPATSSAIRRLR